MKLAIEFDLRNYRNDEDFLFDILNKEYLITDKVLICLKTKDLTKEDLEICNNILEKDTLEYNDIDSIVTMILDYNIQDWVIDTIETYSHNFDEDTIIYLLNIAMEDNSRKFSIL
jgi:hypothetical protein